MKRKILTRQPPRWNRQIVTLLLFVLVSTGCNQNLGPSLLLISIDTLRQDYLGGYGSAEVQSPSLDRLSKQGVLFRECVSPVPITLPAFASIMTSKLPLEHGVRNNGTYQLPATADTLAELAGQAGLQTAAFIAAYPLHSRFGLAQGFEHYDDQFLDQAPSGPAWQAHYNERRGEKVTEAAGSWLRQHARKPYFLWVHYYDPHTPYAPPAPFATLNAGQPYTGEVNYTDRCVEKLLRVAREETPQRLIIAVIADHGEGLGAHGEDTHGTFLYDTTVLVPFILAAPTLPPGLIIDTQVELIDVMPTVLDLMAIPFPNKTGISLLPLIREEPVPDRLPARLESLQAYLDFGWNPLAALRTSSSKIIKSSVLEPYNLSDDPQEATELSPEQIPKCDRESTDSHYRTIIESLTTRHTERELEDEELERLRNLGYLRGSSKEQPSLTEPLPDPRSMTGKVLKLFEVASQAASNRDYASALTAYQDLLAIDPGNPTALERYGHTLYLAGSPLKALAAYETALQLAPDNSRLWVNLSNIYIAMSRLEKAEELLLQARTRFPWDPDIGTKLGDLAFRQNRLETAIDYYEEALEKQKQSPALHATLLQLYTLLQTPNPEKIAFHQKELERLSKTTQPAAPSSQSRP